MSSKGFWGAGHEVRVLEVILRGLNAAVLDQIRNKYWGAGHEMRVPIASGFEVAFQKPNFSLL